MFVLIRGAGDIATGIALRLWRSGFRLAMTDIPQPTAIRRTVCFCPAILNGSQTVEDVTAEFAPSPEAVAPILERGHIPVLADPELHCLPQLRPDVLVDAILAKRNCGTKITDAPVVIGVGPGFCAGKDCHAVVETMRGHYLGRVILQGEAIADTGVPGVIGGYGAERVLRAPADGIFHPLLDIGAQVRAGDTAGVVDGVEMKCTISGILRGILPDGIPVRRGMKSGDIDPRCRPEHCLCASDKAIAVGGGVLQACLQLTGALREETTWNNR